MKKLNKSQLSPEAQAMMESIQSTLGSLGVGGVQFVNEDDPKQDWEIEFDKPITTKETLTMPAKTGYQKTTTDKLRGPKALQTLPKPPKEEIPESPAPTTVTDDSLRFLMASLSAPDGQVLQIFTVIPKQFKTGSRGYYANGKVEINGRRYQTQIQLVEIGSKPGG